MKYPSSTPVLEAYRIGSGTAPDIQRPQITFT